MTELTSRQEAFCLAYADHPNGAAAARIAGYSDANAKNTAHGLLKRSVVIDRIAELQADGRAARYKLLTDLIEKLEPVYEACLAAGDTDGLLQVVELQARIAGLIQGGASIRGRTHSPRSAQPPSVMSHEDALAELS